MVVRACNVRCSINSDEASSRLVIPHALLEGAKIPLGCRAGCSRWFGAILIEDEGRWQRYMRRS